jgi:hypothetical protein
LRRAKARAAARPTPAVAPVITTTCGMSVSVAHPPPILWDAGAACLFEQHFVIGYSSVAGG